MSRVWKDVSLDPDVPIKERAKLAVWDFPVSDKYGKVIEEIVELIINRISFPHWYVSTLLRRSTATQQHQSAVSHRWL